MAESSDSFDGVMDQDTLDSVPCGSRKVERHRKRIEPRWKVDLLLVFAEEELNIVSEFQNMTNPEYCIIQSRNIMGIQISVRLDL